MGLYRDCIGIFRDLSGLNNYLFDKKKVKLFFIGFFLVLKTAVLSQVRVRARVGGRC
jgi:hypothetical protein